MPTVLHSIWAFLLPLEHTAKSSPLIFVMNSVQNLANSVVWFLLIEVVAYCIAQRRRGRLDPHQYSYAQFIPSPCEKFSMLGALRYLLRDESVATAILAA